jgi:thiol:disulfide interchange protein DsbD
MNVYRFTGNVYNSADSQKGEIMRTIILSLIMMLISFPALAVTSSPVDTGRATATLISSHDSILPGQKFYIALQTKLDRNWHTYWQNPGDSGEPVYIDWALPIGIEAGVINWPSPKVIQTGPIVNYGFEGSPIFPVQFSVGKDVEPGSIVTITANFSYLVCKDICIPENGSANLSIAIGPSMEDILQKTKIDSALNKVPKKGDIESTVELKGETIKVGFKNFSLGNISELYFFPYENGYFKNISRKSSRNNNDRLVLELIPDPRRKEIFPSNVRGVLTYKINGIPNSEVIDLDTSKLKLKEKKLLKKNPTNLSFISALFGAFIGGIILNFMPCVFPIISMKAFFNSKTSE